MKYNYKNGPYLAKSMFARGLFVRKRQWKTSGSWTDTTKKQSRHA